MVVSLCTNKMYFSPFTDKHFKTLFRGLASYMLPFKYIWGKLGRESVGESLKDI